MTEVEPPDLLSGGELISRSPEETFEIGRRLGTQAAPGTVILLSGDLGAGKTILTKGIAAGLGINPDEVTSPSFTLINNHKGSAELYHIDLYRLDQGACENLGLDEIFEDAHAISVVEWAERLGGSPRAPSIEILIEYLNGDERKITIKSV